MISVHRNKRGVTLAGLVAAALWSCVPARAQICPLCYQAAASSGAGGILALKRGILILLIPTLIMFGIVLWLLLRRREDLGYGVVPSRAESEDLESLMLDGPISFPATPESHHPSRL